MTEFAKESVVERSLQHQIHVENTVVKNVLR